MARDSERMERLQLAMKEAWLDGLACTLPENVLLLTGYYPVVGTSIALATCDGHTILFAPSDEKELAESAGVSELRLFDPGSLNRITGAVEVVREPLRNALTSLGLQDATVGCESGAAFETSSYGSMHLYGNSIFDLLDSANLRPAGNVLEGLKAVKTPIELDRIRRACRIAEIAFERGRKALAIGLKETEAAENFRAPLYTVGTGFEGVDRAEGHVGCMSGSHAGQAYGAYARSRAKEICLTDLVLTHCNSHADGYWTDITRTYSMAEPDRRRVSMYQAVFRAREAALAATKPGVRAADVDRAAREVIQSAGFGDGFKHSTGHGVGFAAIHHNARPRIHPASQEELEVGMVFNVEPAIYLGDEGGVRHCDMVAVTETGYELLTPFQTRLEELVR